MLLPVLKRNSCAEELSSLSGINSVGKDPDPSALHDWDLFYNAPVRAGIISSAAKEPATTILRNRAVQKTVETRSSANSATGIY